jgi:putative SOS response-associated peptidase YedK
MCGRYPEPYQYKDLSKYFAAVAKFNEEDAFAPRYNIAPTQLAPIVREDDGERQLTFMRWGLVPKWAKDIVIGSRMINARAETLLEKASFRRPFLTQRCLVPAGGFYEWRKEGALKQPFLIRRRDKAPIAFAGLWDTWQDPMHKGSKKQPMETFTIITTAANSLIRPIHERMPLILSPADFDAWLSPGEPPMELLDAREAPELEAVPVSSWVNLPRHDDVKCMEPIVLE